MDPVFLARLQFALTICFHFIFPPITIGLGWLLVIVEGLGWRKNSEVWVRAGKFFGKLFAITFAVGVATGIVMEFQFGTNWADYSRFVGDVFGPPLAAEGVFAFFLESSFLGLYLFGRGRVPKGVHWFAALMVAVGATFSAFWILVANSWQQTPAGFVEPVRDRVVLASFTEAVFNESMWIRFFHTLDAAIITGAFFMAGVSALLILRKQSIDVAGRALKLAVIVGFLASLLALFPTGHKHAELVAEAQPEKFAAFEGLYDGERPREMAIFGLVKTTPPHRPELLAKVEIPGLLSWLLKGDSDAPIKGLPDFPADEVPRGTELWLTFVSFHNMFILGMIFIGMTALGVLLIWRRKILESESFLPKWWLRAMVLVTPLPVVACEFGWVAAEVGRQPWVVYKLLRTEDAASPAVSADEILFSIVLFGAIYLVLGAVWLFLLFKKVRKGPEPASASGVGA